ncbi:MAG TPA: STAS domain-containing protein [Thermoanaerobaculia bacterium]|nr:STAS domain-containing protein [Thermoanaerobaculia bacterium]
MKVQLREVTDVVIVDLEGKLVRGVGDELLRDTLDGLLAEGRGKILLNLSQVSFIDSSGIGELVAGKKVAEQLGAQLKLMRLGNRVRQTLKLSLILPLFDSYEDEQTALASFG